MGDRDVQQLEDTSIEWGGYSYDTQKGVNTQTVLDIISELNKLDCCEHIPDFEKIAKFSKKFLPLSNYHVIYYKD